MGCCLIGRPVGCARSVGGGGEWVGGGEVRGWGGGKVRGWGGVGGVVLFACQKGSC